VFAKADFSNVAQPMFFEDLVRKLDRQAEQGIKGVYSVFLQYFETQRVDLPELTHSGGNWLQIFGAGLPGKCLKSSITATRTA
jgi:hypothetical protein